MPYPATGYDASGHRGRNHDRDAASATDDVDRSRGRDDYV